MTLAIAFCVLLAINVIFVSYFAGYSEGFDHGYGIGYDDGKEARKKRSIFEKDFLGQKYLVDEKEGEEQ